MRHLGDIMAIDGATIEPVDCITFGAPCQDLSMAGSRRGILHADLGDDETSRSGLYMEAVRIIKEMRANDIRHGRHGVDVRPRYAIYENVPGAFSSNSGDDFQIVLTEIVRVVEPDAPPVPLPKDGRWPKTGCLYGVDGKWSIAYKLHDAQWWGVPQRRKRVALVADFNGLTAPEILFDPQYRRETEDAESHEAVADPVAECGSQVPPITKGLPWDFDEGCEARERPTGSSADSTDGTGGETRLDPFVGSAP